MNRIISVSVVALAIAWPSVTSAEEEAPVRSISVSGTAEAKTAPDQIVWEVDLTDTDKGLRAAKARNDEKVKAVIALREKLGIAEGDLEADYVRIRREYERGEHGYRKEFKHFKVSRSIEIRQRDLKRFDEFLDALVASADMEVRFSYGSSRMREVRAETRLKALQAARDKAEAMAKVVGAKLGRVLTINEHSGRGGWREFASNAYVAHSSPAVDVATDRYVPGAISVKVTVFAAFELE